MWRLSIGHFQEIIVFLKVTVVTMLQHLLLCVGALPIMDTWMSNLPETLTNVPLSMLAIPGSHDSCSYCLNCECELSQDNEAFPALMLLGKFGKLLSARWGRTQDVSLSEQLAAGIRYFDFRVIHREVDGLFYFVHGQFANEVSAELSIIRSFLQEHHKEVVLLDFNHLYCFFKPDSTSLLERTIVKVFGSMLTPRSEHIPSLNDLWSGNFQVVCFLHVQTESPVMWTCETISSPWPNTVVVDKLIAFLNSHPPWVFTIFRNLGFHKFNKCLLHLSEKQDFVGKVPNRLIPSFKSVTSNWLLEHCLGSRCVSKFVKLVSIELRRVSKRNICEVGYF